MRILYLSISYVPSRRASSLQVMRMCAALARQGHDVTLVTKRCRARQEPGVEDDYRFYGVERLFRILKLPRPAARGGGLLYSAHQWRALRATEADLVYSRDLVGAWLAARSGRAVLFEAHGPPQGAFARKIQTGLARSRRLRRFVVISEALKARLHALDLLPAHGDLVVAHDASDPLPDSAPPRFSAARTKQIRIGYVGHLYPGRGVEIVLELARRLPACQFEILGGSAQDLARWHRSSRPENLEFRGFLPPSDLLQSYSRFDLLLMPYQERVGVASGRSDTSPWMSPMKMFEYMASGKPMIASALPVLQEVLEHRRNAWLVPPDDLAAWQNAVEILIGDPSLRRQLGEAARQDLIEKYTWDARARAVMNGL